MIPATDPRVQTVIKAYSDMGRPGMAWDDPNVQSWAERNATPFDIWTAASTFVNDPQWSDVAKRAIALLASQPGQTTPGIKEFIASGWTGAGVNPATGQAGTQSEIRAAVNSILDTVSKATGVTISSGAMKYAPYALGAWLVYKILK